MNSGNIYRDRINSYIGSKDYMEKYSGKWVLQTIVDGNPFYLHGAYAHHISRTYTPNTNKVKHALKFEAREAAEKFKLERDITVFTPHLL